MVPVGYWDYQGENFANQPLCYKYLKLLHNNVEFKRIKKKQPQPSLLVCTFYTVSWETGKNIEWPPNKIWVFPGPHHQIHQDPFYAVKKPKLVRVMCYSVQLKRLCGKNSSVAGSCNINAKRHSHCPESWFAKHWCCHRFNFSLEIA